MNTDRNTQAPAADAGSCFPVLSTVLLPEVRGRFHLLAMPGIAVLVIVATLLTSGPGSAQDKPDVEPSLAHGKLPVTTACQITLSPTREFWERYKPADNIQQGDRKVTAR